MCRIRRAKRFWPLPAFLVRSNVNVQHLRTMDDLQGQATFGMANLRKEKTGLPFIVFISQKDGAQHDVRVKVSPSPKVRIDQMCSYSLRPFKLVGGSRLSSNEEVLLEKWVARNLNTLVEYWDGDLEYTEDAIERLESI